MLQKICIRPPIKSFLPRFSIKHSFIQSDMNHKIESLPYISSPPLINILFVFTMYGVTCESFTLGYLYSLH